jgi:hypothetical protein
MCEQWMVRFIANSRLADGVTRERVLQFFQDHAIESSTWDLVRHRIVTDHAFKVGAQPGVVLFLEADSENAAAEIVNGLPVVQNGLWVFDIDPVSAVAHF